MALPAHYASVVLGLYSPQVVNQEVQRNILLCRELRSLQPVSHWLAVYKCSTNFGSHADNEISTSESVVQGINGLILRKLNTNNFRRDSWSVKRDLQFRRRKNVKSLSCPCECQAMLAVALLGSFLGGGSKKHWLTHTRPNIRNFKNSNSNWWLQDDAQRRRAPLDRKFTDLDGLFEGCPLIVYKDFWGQAPRINDIGCCYFFHWRQTAGTTRQGLNI